ncbi:Methyltransferase-like protein 7B [Mizuhopecten yessoensis]|uniref:Methyltransferase-like protein 7B n=1 Tax=Mizuhopecten yessoensis TaxID=6573 RepID=A0A210PVY0_MIZYE|nr:Methyltransferase-like protein 7B [Mizuhopecten yessoensis]
MDRFICNIKKIGVSLWIRHWRLRLAAWIVTRVGFKSNKIFGEHKKDLFHSMKKLKATVGTLKVLEIGAGGGVNFKFYPAGTKVTCLDPNPCFEPYVENNAVVSGLHQSFRGEHV